MPTQINRYKEAAEDKEESRTKKQLRYTFEIFLGVNFVIKNDNGMAFESSYQVYI